MGLFMILSAQFCPGCQFGKASAIKIGLDKDILHYYLLAKMQQKKAK
jgi:hypothetical protein